MISKTYHLPQTRKTVLKVFFYILLGSFMIYFIRQPIANFLYYSFILILFFRSCTNAKVMWFALFFAILANIFMMFRKWGGDIIFLTPTVGVEWSSFFAIVGFIKYTYFHKNHIYVKKNYISRFYKLFVFYIIFLLLWSLIWGYQFNNIIFIFHALSSFLIFGFVPVLFTYKELLRFNKVIFIISISISIIAIIDITTGKLATKLLFFGTGTGKIIEDDDLIRILGGIYISLYSLIIALYYLINKKHNFSTRFLWIVIFFSILFIINSGTRGWMLTTAFILVTFLLYYSNRLVTSPINSILPMFILIIGIFILPWSVQRNIKSSFERFSTLEYVAEGDMTAGGTAGRWTERGPIVMQRFDESPLFGFGYSKVTFNYFDQHVGNHMLLLIGGIVGMAIVIITLFSIVFFLFKTELKGKGIGFGVIAIGLLGTAIIHSTSRMEYSYIMKANTAFFISLLFNHVNAWFNQNHTKRNK